MAVDGSSLLPQVSGGLDYYPFRTITPLDRGGPEFGPPALQDGCARFPWSELRGAQELLGLDPIGLRGPLMPRSVSTCERIFDTLFCALTGNASLH